MIERGRDRLQLTLNKLRMLLDFAQMMGEDRSATHLMERFSSLLNDDLGINRILFFVREDGVWRRLWNVGCDTAWADKIDVARDLLAYNRTMVIRTRAREVLPEIDVVIPLMQEEEVGGYMLLGDTREDVRGVSPVIKHLTFAQALSMIAYVALQNYAFFKRELRERELRQELQLATQLQTMLLQQGNALPQMVGVALATEYMPHYEVGGDFYDLQDLGDGCLGVCVADVSGKGISAAMMTTNFQAIYRAQLSRGVPLPELVAALNARLFKMLQGEKFITIFVARYDLASHRLEYINAGHNPPYLYSRASGEARWLSACTIGIGMMEEMPALHRAEEVLIEDDSVLFCYTDGLVERRDSLGQEHYSTEIVEDAVRDNASAAEIVRSTRERVEQERKSGTARPFDDVTMVVLHFKE